LRHPRVDVLAVDAQGAATDHAAGQQLVLDAVGQVHRDREAEADVAGHRAARVEAGGVDADQLAVEVDQRAAGIARVDAGIGLDEVLVAGTRQVVAADRGDDARGHRLAHAERIADRDHEVADLQQVAVRQRDRGEVLRRDAHQGDVGVRVRAEELGLAPCARRPASPETSSASSTTWLLVSTRPRWASMITPEPSDCAIRSCGDAEHAPEHRVVAERGVHPHALLAVDADHRRQHPLQHRRQRRHRHAVDHVRQRGGGRGPWPRWRAARVPRRRGGPASAACRSRRIHRTRRRR
jgi:hypothetical protein